MRIRCVFALAFLFVFVPGRGHVQAQTLPTGDENPTANTGALKAQIETGGSYDAHSGNATRAVTDLHVPGAVGVYGLDFVRYHNSLRNDRNPGSTYLHPEPIPEQPTDFGSPGWSHSWSWTAAYDEYRQEVGGDGGDEIYTMSITITFPDGHASKYKIIRTKNLPDGQPWPPDPRFGPPYYAEHGETTWTPFGEIHDYLTRMAYDGSEFWLYRADGGAVHFIEDSNWGYQAREVFDPHGLLTTLSYDGNGHLYRVEQDGGRRLNITWNGGVIGRVEIDGSAGMQAVEYQYSVSFGSLTLAHAVYQNDPVPGQTISSVYTYEHLDPPVGFFDAGPLLATADDPRFDGPMRFIRYTHRGTGCRPQGQPQPGYTNGQFDYVYASPTAIAEEKSGGTGMIVSGFTIGCFDGTRTEYDGFSHLRKFFFGRSAHGPGTFSIQGYQLAKLTDFTDTYPLPPGLPFEWQNYKDGHPRQIWDGRGILTETPHEDGSGFPNEIRHTGSDSSIYYYDRVNEGNSDPQDFTRIPNTSHHWLFNKTDERGKTTVYRRDSRRRVTRISYYDGPAQGNPVATEEFTYNILNQVETHTLPSGAVQHYEYNGANQLWREWNSVDGPGEPTIYTYYGAGNHPEWTGLVATSVNPRGAASGAAFSTMMEYNGRQQITKVHYPPTGGNADPTVTYGYDPSGNGDCISITDEMGHISTYEYDDYRRCTRYTEPLNALDWKGSAAVPSRTWNWHYDRYFDQSGYWDASAHTSRQWRVQVEPAYNAAGDRRLSANKFDYQDRIIEVATGLFEAADGTWHSGPDTEVHLFEYDENGNKKEYTDSLGRLTTYNYDLRNRLWKTNETVNTIPRTTETLYDVTGNKTLVTFPDTRTQQWLDYDAFGQPGGFIDERGNTTNLTYQWGPMKKLQTVTTHRIKDSGPGDWEHQLTTFYYDLMGRPQWTIFPDGTSELTTYLFGQVGAFKTRKDQTKRLHYDARGREDYHTWDIDAAPRIDRAWDDANRLASITNVFSYIDFGYDDAGQVIWEGNEIAGSGGRTQTNYFRYPDGSVAHLHYPGGHYIRHDYTSRGQLAATGWDDEENTWWMKLAAYTYLPDGKVDHQDYGNDTRTDFEYDERGMTRIISLHRVSAYQNYSWRYYWRDDRDRITAFQKSTNNSFNPMENGRGDHYAYDWEGQLTDGWYNAVDPAGNFNGWTRRDHFDYDALGNRQGDQNYLAGRNGGSGPVRFTRRDNGLNQYIHWWPAGLDYLIYHDDNSPWAPWNAFPGNGVLMADGWLVASYNALNQPVAMIPYGWANAIGFGYDPLGRCVKRWVGDGGDVYANPATYFHYDGWNLLQEGSNAWGPARAYVHGNRLDEIVWSANTFTGEQAFHHYDARGHCTLLTDSVGGILEQYEYDAFGQPYFYDANGNSIGAFDAQGLWAGYSLFGNRFLFTGREWLSDLKLYDYRNRMYQPELGRFLQPDPKEFAAGDYNLYRYCHNDPVNKSDPTGLDLRDFLFGVMDAAGFGMGSANAEAAGITFDKDGSDYAAGVGTGILIGMATGSTEVRAFKMVASEIRATRAVAPSLANLNRQLAAKEIAGGHAFAKHAAEFGFKTKEQMAAHIEKVMANPSATRELSGGRTAFLDKTSGTVVIRNPNAADGGTAFIPKNSEEYFKKLK